MVRTSEDVMDINPLERMERLEEITNEKKGTIASKKKEYEELERNKKKELEELEKKKKKEFEEFETKKKKELEELDKKKKIDLEELEKKKKELEELEKKKAKEIEETEALIEKSFQELMRHKKQIIAEEDREKKSKNLEDVASTAKETNVKHNFYGKIFENLETPKRLYEITNKNFYNNLVELRDKAARGEITPEEEEFVDRLRTRFESFERNPEYVQEQDKHNYVQRSLNVLDQVGQYSRRR